MADISAPNAGAYGIWGPQLAAALAAQSGSPVAGPLNMLAMHGYAGQEQGGYSADLMQTQQRQLEAARLAAQTDAAKAAWGAIPGAIQYGGLDYIDPMLRAQGMLPNAAAGSARDDLVAQDISAGAFRDRAAGVSDVAAVGFAPTPENLPQALMPTDPTAPSVPYAPYMSPDAINDQTRANAAMKSAEADMVSANRPRSSGGGGGSGGTTYTVEPPLFPGMPPRIVVRTKDSGVADEYMGSGQARPAAPSTDRSGGSVSAVERLRRLREGR